MALSSTALPTLASLRAFLAVAEARSFTRAGELLGLTQTAVSHQIAQIEAFIGQPVFLRSRSGVVLTRAGAALLPSAESAMALLREGVAKAKSEGRRGRIVVQTSPEFGTQWLAGRLQDFVAGHPDIAVSLALDYRRADLASGEADAAIWLGAGGKGVVADRLPDEEEFAVCSPALQARLPEKLAFIAAPLLSYRGSRHTVLDWERWLYQLYGDAVDGTTELVAHLQDPTAPVFESFAEMIAACRAGEGFALVRTSFVKSDLAAGTLVRPVVEVTPSDLHHHFVTTPANGDRIEVATFRDWLLGEVEW